MKCAGKTVMGLTGLVVKFTFSSANFSCLERKESTALRSVVSYDSGSGDFLISA